MSVPILCYHKVGPAASLGRFLNVEAATLDTQIRFLQRRGYQFVLACDLAARVWPDKTACLTFDDCYLSAVSFGLPVLERLRVVASWYAVSSLVGQSSSWDGPIAAPLCGWETLRTLQSMGHEVGNHTARHPHLGQTAIEDQLSELAECDQALREQGLTPGSVCFPYGSYNEVTAGMVERLGYGVGLALGKRLAAEDDDRRCLPRVVVSYSDSVPLLAYKLFVRARLRRASPALPGP